MKGEWTIRDICNITYFIELGNEDGVVSVFTDKPEKTEEVARLIAAAPKTARQRDDLLAVCKKLLERRKRWKASRAFNEEMREHIQSVVNKVEKE